MFDPIESLTYNELQELFGSRRRCKINKEERIANELVGKLFYEDEQRLAGKTTAVLAKQFSIRREVISRALKILEKKGLAKRCKPTRGLVNMGVVKSWVTPLWFRTTEEERREIRGLPQVNNLSVDSGI